MRPYGLHGGSISERGLHLPVPRFAVRYERQGGQGARAPAVEILYGDRQRNHGDDRELRKIITKWTEQIVSNKHFDTRKAIESEIELKFIEEKKISFLQDLKTDADLEFFKEMLDIYIREIPKNIESIRNAIFQNNADHLRFFVHKLKGSSLTLGIECVLDNFKILEDMALDNNINEESLRMFKKVSEQFESILEEIVLLKNKYSNIKFS